MRAFLASGFVMIVGLMSLASEAAHQPVPALAKPEYVDGSLCTKPDQIAFSCPLAKSTKTVSICASGNASPHQFYYAFGHQGQVELSFPIKENIGKDHISVTKLSFSSSWSTVYSFVRAKNKYIVNVNEGMAFTGKSGKEGFRSPYRSGELLVQKIGDDKAALIMSCNKLQIKSDDKLIEESAAQLKSDPDLKDGLPY